MWSNVVNHVEKNQHIYFSTSADRSNGMSSKCQGCWFEIKLNAKILPGIEIIPDADEITNESFYFDITLIFFTFERNFHSTVAYDMCTYF